MNKITLTLVVIASAMIATTLSACSPSTAPEVMDVKSPVITGFRDLYSQSSNFGVSFRPVQGAADYKLRIYDTDTSAMPYGNLAWSENICAPYDERDYCIDVGEGLTVVSGGGRVNFPLWYSLITVVQGREIEGDRVCFDGFDLENGYCPVSEVERLKIIEPDGKWLTVIDRTN